METNLITTTAVTNAYKSFILHTLSHGKYVPNIFHIYLYKTHLSRYTTLHVISVNQSQKIESPLKNTNNVQGTATAGKEQDPVSLNQPEAT